MHAITIGIDLGKIRVLERRLLAWYRQDQASQRLATTGSRDYHRNGFVSRRDRS